MLVGYRVSYFVFCCYCLVVSTIAIDCLERLVSESEMTYYVSSGTLNPKYSLLTCVTCVYRGLC